VTEPVTDPVTDPLAIDDARAQEHPLALTDIEFRGEVIYFIVVDRFHDGDTNNNGGLDASLCDPTRTEWGKYWGGDLQGIIDKLDYLAELGVTALWLTPLFEQIEAMAWDSAPIHGYWTRDFKRIHARWVKGPEEVRLFERDDTTFDRLVAELHRRGMKLVLDVVCNHSSPDVNGVKGQLFDDGELIADFHDDEGRNWYHHYGPVQDWASDWQVKNCELAGLATFNENNDDYRRYVKSAIGAWIGKGVDALRVDTVKHMPLWFWQEFTSDMVSRKPDIFMFGEWIYSHSRLEPSVEFANRSGMTILDFELCMAIRAALVPGSAEGFLLVDAVFASDARYRCATELVTFFENHDMPRLQSLGVDDEGLRLAVILLMLVRGTPCLFYGAEQALHDDTNGGSDPYNRPMMPGFATDGPVFDAVRRASAVRRSNAAVQFGAYVAQRVTPDLWCFTRRYRDGRCFVALSRGEAETLHDVATDLPDGEHVCLLTGARVVVSGGHVADLAVPRRGAVLLARDASPVQGDTIVRFQLNGCRTLPGQTVAVMGSCPELGEWSVSGAYRMEYVNDNLWQIGVPFTTSAGQTVAYKFVVLDERGGVERENRSTRRRAVPGRGLAKWRDTWEQ
jgi:cyclomaltodextrin glucanotransferase